MTTLPTYASDHPDVLAAWQECQAQDDAWRETVRAVEAETGRNIMVTSSSWGDGYPLGLTCPSQDTPPEGWRWDDTRARHYIKPRAKGPGTKEGQALMRRLNGAFPKPRTLLKARFGVPDCVFVGLRAITPGVNLLGGRLWVHYGTQVEGKYDMTKVFGDFYDGGTWFTREPQSAYFAALELEPVLEDKGSDLC